MNGLHVSNIPYLPNGSKSSIFMSSLKSGYSYKLFPAMWQPLMQNLPFRGSSESIIQLGHHNLL